MGCLLNDEIVQLCVIFKCMVAPLLFRCNAYNKRDHNEIFIWTYDLWKKMTGIHVIFLVSLYMNNGYSYNLECLLRKIEFPRIKINLAKHPEIKLKIFHFPKKKLHNFSYFFSLCDIHFHVIFSVFSKEIYYNEEC